MIIELEQEQLDAFRIMLQGDKVSNEKKAKPIMDMIHAYIQSRA